MDKTKILEIIDKTSKDSTIIEYTTEEMIIAVEAYIFIKKGVSININLNKPITIMGIGLPIDMAKELQLLQLSFEDALKYFINNKDKLD